MQHKVVPQQRGCACSPFMYAAIETGYCLVFLRLHLSCTLHLYVFMPACIFLPACPFPPACLRTYLHPLLSLLQELHEYLDPSIFDLATEATSNMAQENSGAAHDLEAGLQLDQASWDGGEGPSHGLVVQVDASESLSNATGVPGPGCTPSCLQSTAGGQLACGAVVAPVSMVVYQPKPVLLFSAPPPPTHPHPCRSQAEGQPGRAACEPFERQPAPPTGRQPGPRLHPACGTHDGSHRPRAPLRQSHRGSSARP